MRCAGGDGHDWKGRCIRRMRALLVQLESMVSGRRNRLIVAVVGAVEVIMVLFCCECSVEGFRVHSDRRCRGVCSPDTLAA